MLKPYFKEKNFVLYFGDAIEIAIYRIIKNNPEFPTLILEDIDLQHIGYKRIIEDGSIISRFFIAQLTEFIEIYTGSKRYIKARIKELSQYNNY